MKYSTLNTFHANGKTYKHVINTKTDTTYLLDAEDDKKIYTVSSDGYMFDCSEDENFIGIFRTEYGNNNNWYLDNRKGVIERHNSCDLIYTELQVFKGLSGK